MDTVERVEGSCFLLDSWLAIRPSTLIIVQNLLQNRIFRPRHKKLSPSYPLPHSSSFIFLLHPNQQVVGPAHQPLSTSILLPRPYLPLFLPKIPPALPPRFLRP
jgi:hypothetical protein